MAEEREGRYRAVTLYLKCEQFGKRKYSDCMQIEFLRIAAQGSDSIPGVRFKFYPLGRGPSHWSLVAPQARRILSKHYLYSARVNVLELFQTKVLCDRQVRVTVEV